MTRDAEVELSLDEEVDLRERVRAQLRQRRFEPVVRLEFGPDADPTIRTGLMERFELTDADVYDLPGELDYTSLFQIASLDYPALRDRPWSPRRPPALRSGHEDIFAAIRSGDVLVHHPYESFDASVEHFISAAADDPATISIKMTVYRVGDDTPFVSSLVRAADRGKQVACVIELQARFDEDRNLYWARALDKAGAKVLHGVAGLKIHAKTALVVRKEAGRLRCYAHIGTGNYNVRTARTYTDVGLLTADPVLTGDVVRFFHYLTGRACRSTSSSAASAASSPASADGARPCACGRSSGGFSSTLESSISPRAPRTLSKGTSSSARRTGCFATSRDESRW